MLIWGWSTTAVVTVAAAVCCQAEVRRRRCGLLRRLGLFVCRGDDDGGGGQALRLDCPAVAEEEGGEVGSLTGEEESSGALEAGRRCWGGGGLSWCEGWPSAGEREIETGKKKRNREARLLAHAAAGRGPGWAELVAVHADTGESFQPRGPWSCCIVAEEGRRGRKISNDSSSSNRRRRRRVLRRRRRQKKKMRVGPPDYLG